MKVTDLNEEQQYRLTREVSDRRYLRIGETVGSYCVKDTLVTVPEDAVVRVADVMPSVVIVEFQNGDHLDAVDIEIEADGSVPLDLYFPPAPVSCGTDSRPAMRQSTLTRDDLGGAL